MSQMQINILHLYPDLLNLYGDKGNIASLKMRLCKRGIDVNVFVCTKNEPEFDLTNADIVFLGGGSDREQEIVAEFLADKKAEFKEYAEKSGVILATCGGFSLLGNYIQNSNGRIDGLGVLDIYTEDAKDRVIGNVVVETDIVSQKIVGFENHSARTYIGNHTPLGKIVYGYGNTGDGKEEGVIYKNVIATHLHGPLLPKNPELCDYILSSAIKNKYPEFEVLEPLSDELENKANSYIVNRFCKAEN